MGGNVTFRKALQDRLNIIQPSQNQIREFLVKKPPSLTPKITVELSKQMGIKRKQTKNLQELSMASSTSLILGLSETAAVPWNRGLSRIRWFSRVYRSNRRHSQHSKRQRLRQQAVLPFGRILCHL